MQSSVIIQEGAKITIGVGGIEFTNLRTIDAWLIDGELEVRLPFLLTGRVEVSETGNITGPGEVVLGATASGEGSLVIFGECHAPAALPPPPTLSSPLLCACCCVEGGKVTVSTLTLQWGNIRPLGAAVISSANVNWKHYQGGSFIQPDPYTPGGCPTPLACTLTFSSNTDLNFEEKTDAQPYTREINGATVYVEGTMNMRFVSIATQLTLSGTDATLFIMPNATLNMEGPAGGAQNFSAVTVKHEGVDNRPHIKNFGTVICHGGICALGPTTLPIVALNLGWCKVISAGHIQVVGNAKLVLGGKLESDIYGSIELTSANSMVYPWNQWGTPNDEHLLISGPGKVMVKVTRSSATGATPPFRRLTAVGLLRRACIRTRISTLRDRWTRTALLGSPRREGTLAARRAAVVPRRDAPTI